MITFVIFFCALTLAESFSLMEKGNDVYVPKSEKNEVSIAIVNTNSKDAPTPRVPQYRVRNLRGYGKRSADHSDTGTNAVRKIYYSKRTAGDETMLTPDTRMFWPRMSRPGVNEKLPTKIPKKFLRVGY